LSPSELELLFVGVATAADADVLYPHLLFTSSICLLQSCCYSLALGLIAYAYYTAVATTALSTLPLFASSSFSISLLLSIDTFRYYQVAIGLVYSIHDSTEVAIKKD
jgi:hypothetical protein